MSEREKQILETIAEALPKMEEFDKGYFLGVAEANAKNKKRNSRNTKSQSQETG